jgi:hypothetical protein
LVNIALDLTTTAESFSVMDIDSQDVRMGGLNDYEENDESFDRDPSKIQRRHMNDDEDDDGEEDINGDRTHSKRNKVRTLGLL